MHIHVENSINEEEKRKARRNPKGNPINIVLWGKWNFYCIQALCQMFSFHLHKNSGKWILLLSLFYG